MSKTASTLPSVITKMSELCFAMEDVLDDLIKQAEEIEQAGPLRLLRAGMSALADEITKAHGMTVGASGGVRHE